MAGAAEELVVARLAAAQHGIVTTPQLLAAAVGPKAIRRRVAGGWLVRIHEGVYQVGVFAGPLGREMAALLACGPQAAISHNSAVFVLGVAPRPSGPAEVSSVGGIRRRGVRAHRVAALDSADVVEWHGLRITAPGRTLVDLADTTPPAELERLVEEIQVQRLATPADLLGAIGRGAGRPGVRKLRTACDFIDEPAFTRSEAERRLRRLVNAAELPMPRLNVRVAGWEVDAVWDRQRLVVEVDGYRYHRTRAKFERDRRKDAKLLVAGYRVLRITWRQLTREPESVIATLAATLVA
jgi:very-short-patch-repair endonuclease